jgi:hypothetical protein
MVWLLLLFVHLSHAATLFETAVAVYLGSALAAGMVFWTIVVIFMAVLTVGLWLLGCVFGVSLIIEQRKKLD